MCGSDNSINISVQIVACRGKCTIYEQGASNLGNVGCHSKVSTE